MNNLTALVSCFARAYHFKSNSAWVFKDEVAPQLLTDEEYQAISDNMSAGISFFCPEFQGTSEEALRFIVDHQLSPSVLARSAFCQRALRNAVMLGCRQYVVFASGYDTFSLRNQNPNLMVYELDLPEMIQDKKQRLLQAGYQPNDNTAYLACDLSDKTWGRLLWENGFCSGAPSFGSLLGLSYYLKKEDFLALVRCISDLWSEGSSLCFDYPTYEQSQAGLKNQALAKQANEKMQAQYTFNELEAMLSDCGFLIYEHLDDTRMTDEFFQAYNAQCPENRMSAPKGVHYCLAVKKR